MSIVLLHYLFRKQKKKKTKPIVEDKNIKRSSMVLKVKTDKLNVRKGPGFDYEVIRILHKGDIVWIDANTVSQNSTWGRLQNTNDWININQ